MNENDDISWVDIMASSNYYLYGMRISRDEALKLAATKVRRRSEPANVQTHTYDYITVDEDGTISAGTIARGTTYVWRPNERNR